MSSFQSDARFARPLKQEMALRDKAAAGDMVLVCTPATVTPAPTTAAWTRDVVITLETAAGKIHSWFDKSITSGVSIAGAGGGTASIPSTTLVLKNGKATVTVSGTEATWANGETDTLTATELVVMGYTISAATSLETFTT
jgi:hypothetical protein